MRKNNLNKILIRGSTNVQYCSLNAFAKSQNTIVDFYLIDLLSSFFSAFRICLQISNGSYSGVREILEEFFSTWVYKDNHYILNDAGVSAKGFHGKKYLDIDEYMDVVDLYTFGVLGKDSNDMGLAISWVEEAALPEERRQVLLNHFS